MDLIGMFQYDSDDDDEDDNDADANGQAHNSRETEIRAAGHAEPHLIIWLNVVEKLLLSPANDQGFRFEWSSTHASRLIVRHSDRIQMILEVPAKDPFFPSAPPVLHWIGPAYSWEHNLALLFYDPFLSHKWNLCQDVSESFLEILNYVTPLTPLAPTWEPSEIEQLLILIVEVTRSYPSAFDSRLPAWGILREIFSESPEQHYHSKKRIRTSVASKDGVGYSFSSAATNALDMSRVMENTNKVQGILMRLNNLLDLEVHLSKLLQAGFLSLIEQLVMTCTLQELEQKFGLFYEIYRFAAHAHLEHREKLMTMKLVQLWKEWKEVSTSSSTEETMPNTQENTIDTIVQSWCAEKDLNPPSPPPPTILSFTLPTYEEILSSAQFLIMPPMTTATTTLSPTARRRVSMEWKDLQKYRMLPLEGSGGSVFMRWGGPTDPAVFQIMMCPAQGTPYSGGCFCFDMIISETYPEKAPQVKFLTTGNDTVRFNPNLYACGKVCLSLLGTWSGEPWNPKLSNLTQVLMSILAMIFVDDPFFNEPGYNHSRGSVQGTASSQAYNRSIRYHTIRWAVLEVCRNPPVGFEDVSLKHFRFLWKKGLGEEYQSWAEDPEHNIDRAQEMRAWLGECEKILFP